MFTMKDLGHTLLGRLEHLQVITYIARKPYIFCDFSGGPDPLSPSGSALGMHLKEGTCLKCSFQHVVIIGRKIGLD